MLIKSSAVQALIPSVYYYLIFHVASRGLHIPQHTWVTFSVVPTSPAKCVKDPPFTHSCGGGGVLEFPTWLGQISCLPQNPTMNSLNSTSDMHVLMGFGSLCHSQLKRSMSSKRIVRKGKIIIGDCERRFSICVDLMLR